MLPQEPFGNGWDKDIADAREESKVDHGESLDRADTSDDRQDISDDRQDATDQRMDESDALADEQRTEATAASRRITTLEELADEARNRRISARLTYIVLGAIVAMGLIFGSQVLGQLEEDQQRIEAVIAKQNSEALERRHQICLRDEREHKEAVQSLERTYEYILQLTPDEADSTLNRFVIQGLPRTEREALTDRAPEFCDGPGEKHERLYERTDGREGSPPVGLPEPDPELPERPAEVDRLVRELRAG